MVRSLLSFPHPSPVDEQLSSRVHRFDEAGGFESDVESFTESLFFCLLFCPERASNSQTVSLFSLSCPTPI